MRWFFDLYIHTTYLYRKYNIRTSKNFGFSSTISRDRTVLKVFCSLVYFPKAPIKIFFDNLAKILNLRFVLPSQDITPHSVFKSADLVESVDFFLRILKSLSAL